MRKLLLALSLTITTTGCADNKRIARPENARLECANEPPAPGASGEPVTDQQDADYKLGLRDAWQDCHSTVKWLKDWFAKLPN